MADLIRAMLYHCLVPGWELFAITISIIIRIAAQTIAEIRLTVSQHISTLNHCSSPLRIWEHLPPNLRSRCQQDNNSGLAVAFLFTALALFTLIYICSIIFSHPPRQIHPDTVCRHTLERAITRQIEINYHLSRPSQNRKLQNPNCNTAEFKQWALHWSNIKRFREQAEADFKQGATTCYYDDYLNGAERHHELKIEQARVHSLGRNIVNAREEARRYIGNIMGGRNGAVVGGEGWMRQKVQIVGATQIDKMDTRGRSGFGMSKASEGKTIFQQQVDAVGRITPGGRCG